MIETKREGVDEVTGPKEVGLRSGASVFASADSGIVSVNDHCRYDEGVPELYWYTLENVAAEKPACARRLVTSSNPALTAVFTVIEMTT